VARRIGCRVDVRGDAAGTGSAEALLAVRCGGPQAPADGFPGGWPFSSAGLSAGQLVASRRTGAGQLDRDMACAIAAHAGLAQDMARVRHDNERLRRLEEPRANRQEPAPTGSRGCWSLVGVDGSAASQAALEFALRRGRSARDPRCVPRTSGPGYVAPR
jgi:hypothetical protein